MCQFEDQEALGSQVLECEKITQTEGRTPREGKQPEGGKIKRSFQKNRSGKKRPDVVPERNKEEKEKEQTKSSTDLENRIWRLEICNTVVKVFPIAGENFLLDEIHL
ncbi:hypothetical protein CDAR_456441 [Caerostris darwini]|uniref:Uncharacterized protein n=1 Tax=Caerostris darwini TaxID=1538125 RepID=A0AAV4P238_9ARAC|nr:hypothetical protein CDAR_456441 [Caerostris darwini]